MTHWKWRSRPKSDHPLLRSMLDVRPALAFQASEKVNGGCHGASDIRRAGRGSKSIVDRVEPARMTSAIMTTTAAR